MTTKPNNPETAINQGMEQMKAEELSRILRAGYPTIEFHEPEGDSAAITRAEMAQEARPSART